MYLFSDSASFNYYSLNDEVDSDKGVFEKRVGGSQTTTFRPQTQSTLYEPKVELRSFFPEGWLFSLEQLKATSGDR